ncbi:MAG: hypothetical protein HYV59_14580 [Planctomycetes bacterium]|nr:hypothetical protein [Planctomycetota bacterium]
MGLRNRWIGFTPAPGIIYLLVHPQCGCSQEETPDCTWINVAYVKGN